LSLTLRPMTSQVITALDSELYLILLMTSDEGTETRAIILQVYKIYLFFYLNGVQKIEYKKDK
jgi:hypothetical protein